jgi:hypothetical protein
MSLLLTMITVRTVRMLVSFTMVYQRQLILWSLRSLALTLFDPFFITYQYTNLYHIFMKDIDYKIQKRTSKKLKNFFSTKIFRLATVYIELDLNVYIHRSSDNNHVY